MFKHIYTLFFFFILNSYALENTETYPQIKYGYPNQSIFVAKVNGKEQPITPMLFIAKELFKRAGLSYKATAYPAKRLFRNLKNGETNFTILVKASSLLDDFIFSSKPVYTTSLNVYYIGDKPPILEKEDFVRTHLVTIRGYSYGKLGKFINDPLNSVVKEVTDTHSSAFKMLKLGRADYVLDYASAAQDIIVKSSIDKLRSNTISDLDIYLVLSKSYPNAQELMHKLEAILESMNIEEVMERSIINEKY